MRSAVSWRACIFSPLRTEGRMLEATPLNHHRRFREALRRKALSVSHSPGNRYNLFNFELNTLIYCEVTSSQSATENNTADCIKHESDATRPKHS
ncbi:hypothetical protein KOW79_008444 [Hemibagrus wyckioides]|uniref:Uncharacterized protein n=1 Tax=Hemibagrus wyckioides TaxID=337641 RepID=A0A9D3NWI5_9TELE|nr:hypothetical protein KOW79_008444 [Hemibagrus wyckioides]